MHHPPFPEKRFPAAGILGCALVLAAGLTAARAAVEADGRVRPVVIRAEGRYRPLAATLADYLTRMTRAPVPVNPVAPPPDAVVLQVGNSADRQGVGLTPRGAGPIGYWIRYTEPDRLILAGTETSGVQGTAFSVFDFLKQFGGYRWFMPGELGEIVPERGPLPIPFPIDQYHVPSFEYFCHTGLAGYFGVQRAFSRADIAYQLSNHSLFSIVPPDQYGLAHPEYYPLGFGGRRRVPRSGQAEGWQPCVSNPDLPALAVRWAHEYFRRYPDKIGFPVSVNDGVTECQCRDCRAVRAVHRNAYVPFYNAVGRLAARELPGKWVGFLAYGNAAEPPVGLALGSNLLVQVMNGLLDGMAPLKAWRAAGAGKLGLSDYHFGREYVVPRHYPRIMGAAWKQARREFGLAGINLSAAMRSWWYEGPRVYVLNELVWDIAADPDALLDDYFLAFYGAAAGPPMRRFFDRIEDIYGRRGDPLFTSSDHYLDVRAQHNTIGQFADYTREDLDYLDAALAAAEAAADSAPVRARLWMFKKLFGLSRLYLEAHVACREVEAMARFCDRGDVERVIETLVRAHCAARAIEAYSMTPEEEALIFSGTTTLDEYRGSPVLRPDVYLDNAADRVLARVPDSLASGGRREPDPSLWAEWADRPGLPGWVRSVLLTQRYAREITNQTDNLAANSSFELDPLPQELRRKAEMGAACLIYDGHRKRDVLLARFPGWDVSRQPVTRSIFSWCPGEARTGRASLSIRDTYYRSFYNHRQPVERGCRYRVTVWIKQRTRRGNGALSLHALEGSKTVRHGAFPFPSGALEDWRRLQATLSIPDEGDENYMLLCRLSVGRQDPDEAVWFDDFSIEKIFDPAWDSCSPGSALDN